MAVKDVHEILQVDLDEFLSDEELIKLKNELKFDENCTDTVYMDSEKHLTYGCGHLVLPEDNVKEGDKVTEDMYMKRFKDDIQVCCRHI